MEEAYTVCDEVYEYTLPVRHEDSIPMGAVNGVNENIHDKSPCSQAKPEKSNRMRISQANEKQNVAMEKKTIGLDSRNVTLLRNIAFALLACALFTLISVVTLCVLMSPSKSEDENANASCEKQLNQLKLTVERLGNLASHLENSSALQDRTNNSLNLFLLEQQVKALQQQVKNIGLDSLQSLKIFENMLNESSIDILAKAAQIIQKLYHLSTQMHQSSSLLVNLLSNNVTLLYVSNNKLNWFEAEKTCVALGGHLVTVDSRFKADIVHEKAKSHNLSSHWIGLRANTTDENDDVLLSCSATRYWVATNASYDLNATDYNEWHAGEPNGCGSNTEYGIENCVQVILDEKGERHWHDSSCTFKQFNYVCEINVEVALGRKLTSVEN